MFSIKRLQHPDYGSVVVIESVDIGLLPLQVISPAIKEYRAYRQQSVNPVRFLINEQIMTLPQMEKWAHDEHRSLPKCQSCAKILVGEVHPGGFRGDTFFCSELCAHQNYLQELDKIDDEHECDFR